MMKVMVFLFCALIDFLCCLCYNKSMTEFQPAHIESGDAIDKLTPIDIEERGLVVNRVSGILNDRHEGDLVSGEKDAVVSSLLEAVLLDPAVNLDTIRKAIDDLDKAEVALRDSWDEYLGGDSNSHRPYDDEEIEQ